MVRESEQRIWYTFKNPKPHKQFRLFVEKEGVVFCPNSQRAEVAQLVEQLTRNEQVAGSIPVFGSILMFHPKKIPILLGKGGSCGFKPKLSLVI